MILKSNHGQRTPGIVRFNDSKSLEPGQYTSILCTPAVEPTLLQSSNNLVENSTKSSLERFETVGVENSNCFLKPLSTSCKVCRASSNHCNHDKSYRKRISIIRKFKQYTRKLQYHHADHTFHRLLLSIMQCSSSCLDVRVPYTLEHPTIAESRPVILIARETTRPRKSARSDDHDQHFAPAAQLG